MYTFYTNNLDMPKWPIRKLLFIMRLTTVLLIVSMLQVSASGFGQRLSYVRKQATLLELFKEIKVQTGYNVVWPEQDVNTNTSIKVNFKNTPITAVLDQSLKGLNLSYVINNKTLIIRAKTLSFLEKSKNVIQRIFQDISVRGYVVDENNEPLTGAIVKVKGSNRSTTTNEQGVFLLANVGEQSILIISYLGYESLEIKATVNTGTIKLGLNTGKLQEVEINAGYYTVKERELTGNISKVTAEIIANQPVNNLLIAMVGRVPGLEITQSSGVPGGGFTVRIRGQSSIRSGNDPLYIVDGVIFSSTKFSGDRAGIIFGEASIGSSPLSLINPLDIESIEILKDADATAIFGSRGANGVILISTKKGIAGETKISAAFSQGFSQVARKVDLLNTEQYLDMRMEAYKNDGLQPGLTDYDVNGTWDKNRYTDWQKELIGGTAPTTNASLSLTGGTTKSNYLIGGNYYKEGTVYPGKFDFKRFGIRSSINLGSVEDRFNAIFTTNLNYTKSDLLLGDLTSSILMPPNAPAMLDQYGQINWAENTVFNNPMANLLKTNDAVTNSMIGNLALSYRILKNLIIKTSLGYTTTKRQELTKEPLASYSPLNNFTSKARESYFGNNLNNYFIAEPQLTYKTKLRFGTLDALFGMSLQDNRAQVNVVKASNFTSDDLMENLGSAGTITNGQSSYSQYRYFAVFGRLNYNLSGKYLINLTARRDGSTRFGPGKQFANFGAVGAAWIFSDEKFIQESLRILSFGKLRASYGLTGNDQISNYAYLQLWNTNLTYQGSSTLIPGVTAPNNDFAWETNRKLEAALQLGFLKDRINLDVSFYRNRSSNQLLFQPLPLSTALSGIYRNLPATVQNTGWEIEINAKILAANNFQWSAGFNLTIPKNILLSYPGLESSVDAITYKVGEPLSILKVYNVTVDKQTGLYTFEDNNGNGTRDDGDRYLTSFLGQQYYGGFQNSVRYRQFSFDVHIAFVKQDGNRAVGSTTPGRWLVTSNSNQYLEVLDRWLPDSQQSSFQRYTTISSNNTLNTNVKHFGNLSIVDASYIRLRNVSLAWSLPKSFLSALKINNASVSLQGQNLFTLTNYSGLDPEIQSLSLPPLRTLVMGLNITF